MLAVMEECKDMAVSIQELLSERNREIDNDVMESGWHGGLLVSGGKPLYKVCVIKPGWQRLAGMEEKKASEAIEFVRPTLIG